jgi:hypothetical protein
VFVARLGNGRTRYDTVLKWTSPKRGTEDGRADGFKGLDFDETQLAKSGLP